MSVARELVERARALYSGPLPAEVRRMAALCMLDVAGCAIAGRDDEAVRLVLAEAKDQGGAERANVFGDACRLPAGSAALVNGTAAHALDYDDVNVAIPGHASAVLAPALLACAQAHGAPGADLVSAFVAGYETTCRLGRAVAPGHYERGFHSTSTLGAVGASVAAGCLLGLDANALVHAVALGATQGSGLKNLFGTMGKPLHAGLAARAGVLSASLAARGFRGSDDAIGGAQGFARALADGIDEAGLREEPAGGFHILSNLFKYHAACYGTHAALECARVVRSRTAFDARRVREVRLVVPPGSDSYCNIAAPTTGNEGKFSLRWNAALGLLGIDTGALEAYTDDSMAAREVVRLRDRVRVDFDPALPMMATAMRVVLDDGTMIEERCDAGLPESDRAVQRARVTAKFMSLAGPRIGAGRAESIVALFDGLEDEPSPGRLFALANG